MNETLTDTELDAMKLGDQIVSINDDTVYTLLEARDDAWIAGYYQFCTTKINIEDAKDYRKRNANKAQKQPKRYTFAEALAEDGQYKSPDGLILTTKVGSFNFSYSGIDQLWTASSRFNELYTRLPE
jgi:hypothetical protein